MSMNCARSFLLSIMIVCLVGGVAACDAGNDDSTGDTGKSSDPGSTDDPADAGGETDSATESVQPATTEADLLEETASALSGIVMVSRYIDGSVPTELVTAAFTGFAPEWNSIAPDFCERLGNRISCPAVTCDKETGEASLSYESSFDGCDVTGCFFASKAVSGTVRFKRSDDGEAVVVTFSDFRLGELAFDGVVEVQAAGDVKAIAFSGDDAAGCSGLHITKESGYEACISGGVSVTAGDDDATDTVEEKRTVEMTNLTFGSAHHDVVLDGTLAWVEGVDCLGPQTGTVTVSVETIEKTDDGNPLLAAVFSVNFDPENRGAVQAVIQGSDAFAGYETILPRGVFCSLPKVDEVAFSHGSIEDFKETEFAAALVVAVVEAVTKKTIESPKVKALRALTEGLTADDILVGLQELGGGKLIRFIQAPVKGLCMLSEAGTCPVVSVECGTPAGAQTETRFFDCNDIDIGYELGAADDPVPETLTLDFKGAQGCTTSEGVKYGGKIIVERSLDDATILAFTFEDFAVYRMEGDTEIADTVKGKIFGETALTSEPCVTDNELLGSVTFATPVFTDGGDMGLAFQKGTCPETNIVLNPFTVTLSDESDTVPGRDRAAEAFYLQWEQDDENYYLSTLAADVPADCADRSDWPDWVDDTTVDGVYYDLPMSCSCPLEGPLTLGTEAYAIELNNTDCVDLCKTLGSGSPGLDAACKSLCDIVVPEGAEAIQLASAKMSLTLGFQSACGEIEVCESATLREVPDTECLDRSGKVSNTPCATMLSVTNSDAHRADCFEQCVTQSGLESSGFATQYFEDQFGDVDELLSTVCVALTAS